MEPAERRSPFRAQGARLGRRALTGALALALSGCTTYWRANYAQPRDYARLKADQPFLKAHLRDGSVYVLERWTVLPDDRTLRGPGLRYDAQREVAQPGEYTLAFADIALVETNQPESVPSGLVLLGVVTGASLMVTGLCLANPKACFGSCPTFYAEPEGPILAEGFSSSIARTLEATDVDALPAGLGDGAAHLSLWMKNEALETHVVRRVRLLAVPQPEGAQVLRAGDAYFATRPLGPPTRCHAASGDCTALVARAGDGVEFRSPASPTDLAERETLELTLPPAGRARAGLVLRARSSLVETFAFYQLMAWLGLQADDWFLQLEKLGEQGRVLVENVIGRLGHIEVEVRTLRGWVHAGQFSEVGPLAFDEALVPLPEDLPPGPVEVRLALARGAWKLDAVGLVALGEPLPVETLEPSSVERRGEPVPSVRHDLVSGARPLVTRPGDAWRFDFPLPAGPHRLFLESRGYYYEWMRQSWLGEASSARFIDALLDPDEFYRRLAPDYARVEPHLEELFWNSRVRAR